MESDPALNSPNIHHSIRLEIGDDFVLVEIDGVRGEVRDGQAREVREALAHAAIRAIQQSTRARRAEAEYLAQIGTSQGEELAGATGERFLASNARNRFMGGFA